MRGLLIAGTLQPETETTPLPILLAKALSAYRDQFHPEDPLHLLAIPAQASEEELGDLWQSYAQLFQDQKAVALVYPGSLGDGVTDQVTVADWAKDWRVPVLLTLPVLPQMISQSVAFCGLARQAGSQIRGIILCESVSDPIVDREGITQQIQSLARVPVLGTVEVTILRRGIPEELAAMASGLDWELLGL